MILNGSQIVIECLKDLPGIGEKTAERLAFSLINFDFCSLLSITIGYSGICSLNNISAFEYTQITSSTGDIYVPASLVNVYKSAKNWSYFSTQICPGITV